MSLQLLGLFCLFITFLASAHLQSESQHLDLNFRAINYSADVYINGHKKVLPKGMFRRHSLDVSEVLHPDGTNLLAVLVHPPDHPGRIPIEGGQGGDHEVCKSSFFSDWFFLKAHNSLVHFRMWEMS